MSLRTEIRSAIDQVSPPAPTLETKVIAYVAAEEPKRRRLSGRRQGRVFRAPLALVAAVLLVALVGGLILAGRYWRELNSPPQTISLTELRGLEGRPLAFPAVPPGATCPFTPSTVDPNLGFVIGSGPLYLTNGDWLLIGQQAEWMAVTFNYQAVKPGLVLIRARDLKTNQTVAFAQYPFGPSGVIATGQVTGSDHVEERSLEMRSEAVARDPWHTQPINKQGELPYLKAMLG